jgi:putative DNA-invertase from lambdoid prophage Rac
VLAVFAEFERDILRDRVKAGIAQARKEGRPRGRPAKIVGKTQEIRDLARNGLSKSAITKQLNIGRTSVRRLLADA